MMGLILRELHEKVPKHYKHYTIKRHMLSRRRGLSENLGAYSFFSTVPLPELSLKSGIFLD